MEKLNDDVLRLILKPFKNQAESFFIRLVCKRWASTIEKPKLKMTKIASPYALRGDRNVLEWLHTHYDRYSEIYNRLCLFSEKHG